MQKLDARDARRLRELRELLDREFGKEAPTVVIREDGTYPTQPVYTVTLEKALPCIRYVVLEEEIAKGQRVESFCIMAMSAEGNSYPIYQGTCIGHKKMCQLQDPFAFQNPLTAESMTGVSRFQVRITAARDEVILKSIRVYE